MATAPWRRIVKRVRGPLLFAAALALGGCIDYQTAEFTTNQDVALRFGQADDSHITAYVPKGTPVERLGWVGAECECWLVSTPYGWGWVYTRYLTLHLADSPLHE